MGATTVLAIVGVTWYTGMWGICLLGWNVARTRHRNRPSYPPPLQSSKDAPGVSILRPLRGLDCNLIENLESSFRQDYPKFEIIFSVAEEDDQAVPIVRGLIEKYPGVRARLIIGDEDVGPNPKINNLTRSYRSAANDIIWVLDSNALTLPSTLSHSVTSLLTPPSSHRDIGLVHHVPFAIIPDSSWGSRVEHAFLCTTHAKMYLAINATGIDPCVNGKSNLYCRSDLEATKVAAKYSPPSDPTSTPSASSSYKGLQAVGQYLGEDQIIAEGIWHDLGKRTGMTCDVAGNTVGSMSLSTYFWRRVRWIRIRKYMVTAATLAEPFTESILLGILASLSISHLLSIPPYLFFPFHLITWHMLDISVYNSLLRSSPLPPSQQETALDRPGSWGFLQAWLVRECLAFPVWCFAMFGGDTVGWRGGKRYRMRAGGRVEIVREGGEDGSRA